MGPKQRYAFLQGSLADLNLLPVLRTKGGLDRRLKGTPAALEGQRNNRLFSHCAEQAQYCDTLDDLLDVARTFNLDCLPPLSDAEVVKTATSAWNWTLGGKVRHGMVSVPRPAIKSLAVKNPDALALFTVLAELNGRESTFWIANGMARTHVALTEQRLVRARNHLLELGIIKRLSRARQGSPALYRWGEAHGCSFMGGMASSQRSPAMAFIRISP